jgi:hypothetical protein
MGFPIVLGLGALALLLLASGKGNEKIANARKAIAALQRENPAELEALGVELDGEIGPPMRVIALAIKGNWQSYPMIYAPTKIDPKATRSTSVWAQTMVGNKSTNLADYASAADAEGLPVLAQYLRTRTLPTEQTAKTTKEQSRIAQHAAEVPPPGLPGSENVQQIVAAALATGDPSVMRATAAALRKSGHASAAEDLEVAAAIRESEIKRQAARAIAEAEAARTALPKAAATTTEAPAPKRTIDQPDKPAPSLPEVDLEKQQPASIQVDKAKSLSSHLNLLIESRGGVAKARGREDQALVRDFQRVAGLQIDGKYGPGTAKAVGRYYGDVPIVMYWPKGTLPNTAVPPYRAALLELADESKAQGYVRQSILLQLSAAREKGQGFGSGVAQAKVTEPRLQSADKWLQEQQRQQTGGPATGDQLSRFFSTLNT